MAGKSKDYGWVAEEDQAAEAVKPQSLKSCDGRKTQEQNWDPRRKAQGERFSPTERTLPV